MAAAKEPKAPSKGESEDNASESGEYREFDIGKRIKQPGDGDLCRVRVFDGEKAKAVDGPLSIFDGKRGVFFRDPKHGGGGSPVGARRDNYKAARVRNVVAFVVVKKRHDPAAENSSVLDHARSAAHASDKPAKVQG